MDGKALSLQLIAVTTSLAASGTWLNRSDNIHAVTVSSTAFGTVMFDAILTVLTNAAIFAMLTDAAVVTDAAILADAILADAAILTDAAIFAMLTDAAIFTIATVLTVAATLTVLLATVRALAEFSGVIVAELS